MLMKKKFEIMTLGCKVNQSESIIIAEKLRKLGFQESRQNDETESPSPGTEVSLCVINTCTVTEKASMQSRQAIRRAIRQYPGARIVVTGCYAETQPDEIRKISGVDDVIGRCDKHCLVERLDFSRAAANEKDLTLSFPLWHEIPPEFSFPSDHSDRTRAFLKIQDGCDAHCTYCIVPRARGKSRSMPADMVLTNMRRLEKAGYKEMVLSGIHLGSYGKDLGFSGGLSALLTNVEESSITARIRLSSIEPMELNKEIIRLTAASANLCPHFHIPLQSGDDTVLKRMGRPYSAAYFKDLVLDIHQRIPEAAIGADILIGFPGETDSAFENTYQLIDSLPVSYLHVFPFSPRTMTPAEKFSEKLPIQIVKARANRMRILGGKKKKLFYEQSIGKTATVLVEAKIDPKTGYQKGTTTNYIPVYLPAHTAPANTIVDVRLVKRMGEKGIIGCCAAF
jgi:threonylcarbamoyladenosine tRNA methylthiotransferase MtaB